MTVSQLNLADLPEPAEALPAALIEDPSIERTLSAVRGHLGVETVVLARWVEDGHCEVTHVLAEATPLYPVGHRIPVQESFGWHVLQGSLPEILPDLAAHELAVRLAAAAAFPAGSFAGTPVTLPDGTQWGMLTAFGHNADATLGHRDLEVVRAFASLVADRIEAVLADQARLSHTRSAVEGMLDGHAINVFQQPIHSLSTGKPVGIECLARFPDLKKRGPDAWFDDAGSVGLGVDLEMAAVRVALDTLAHVPEGMFAAINASPESILSGALERELEAFEGMRGTLVVEVTEHHQIDDFDALRTALDGLRDKALIAIDDVGTGYTGLRHIVDLKPDMLKMDMSLTRDVHRDSVRQALVGALASFAREIDCVLVAEGIESEEERAALAAIGVDFGQGYRFARPLPVVAAQQHLMGAPGFGAAEA